MGKIEFDSYLALGWNAIPQELQIDFISYFEYFLQNGLDTLEQRLKDTLELDNFPSRNSDQIIEGILACSPKELEKKRNDKNYYICNAICLLDVVKRIFSSDLFDILKNADTLQIAKHNYEHILKWMLTDAAELQTLYKTHILKDAKYKSFFDSRYIQTMPVHQVLRQSLFGQVSPNSFADMEISSSIAVIRQLIELRIRRAFGVLSYVDEKSGVFHPLSLSTVFQCLKNHEKDISFPLKINNIERIYKWANMYVHSGKCELSWIPYYIENILKELTFGRQNENSWNINSGISASNDTIQKIQTELLEGRPKLIQGNKNITLFTCKPECIH